MKQQVHKRKKWKYEFKSKTKEIFKIDLWSIAGNSIATAISKMWNKSILI